MFRIENVPFMLVLYFLIFLGFNIYYTAFPIFAAVVLEWSPAELGIYFSVISAMMAFVQGPVLAKLSARYTESVLIIMGGTILGLQFLLIIPGNTYLLYLAAVFFCIWQRGDVAMHPVDALEICRQYISGICTGFCHERRQPCKHTGSSCRGGCYILN